MLSARQVAQYFLGKDTKHTVFNKDLIQMNGRKFYDGNARLNKYLHMAQNLYIAKTGEKLFQDDLYAYDNGAVVPEIQENYALLLNRVNVPELPEPICSFLDKLYEILGDASLEDLIALSHEDDEWIAKHSYYRKAEQRMDSMARVTTYQQQYSDILSIMDEM